MPALSKTRACCAAALWAALLPHAAAQLPVPPGFPGERARERLPEPGTLRPQPAPDFRLPPFSPPPDAGRLSSALRVKVARFEFTGNTVFSGAELRAEVAQYEGREIGAEELEEARRRVTTYYISRGYINSGALIPDQEVVGGVVRVQIVEGRLSEVQVTSENRFHPDFIRSRVAPPAGEPLNIVPLQERIQVLLQNPRIERVNAELGPGERAGEAVLRLDVKEAPPHEVGLVVANNRSPAVGGNYLGVRLATRNLLGRGIGLSFSAGQTLGMEETSLALAIPVTPQDTVVSLRHEKNRAVVIEQPFSLLDIVSRYDALEFGVSHPVYKTAQQELAFGAFYMQRESQTFLLGQPFSFTPGIANGVTKVTATLFSVSWLDRSETQVLAVRLWVKFGLDLPGATINPGFADSKFVSRYAQLQWVRRLSEAGNQLVLRFDAQGSNGMLLPSEKLSVGGMESVRGYRENRLVKDQGWFGSIEYRHPVGRWLPPGFSDRAEGGQIQLASFVDTGRAADDRDASPGPRVLTSAGVGVRWDLTAATQTRLYLAKPLQKVATPNPTPQDRGVHFSAAFVALF